MKHTLRLLLTVGLSLVCVSLYAQKLPNYPIPQRPDTLRILGIGNSFTDDGMMYLPELLEAAGIRNVVLGRLYIGGCSLERHCREYAAGNTSYTYSKSTDNRWETVSKKATLLDGSYHPVDSSEMAFIMAAKLAYKAAMPEAGPVILEPIHTLKAHVPNDNTGDIMGDVTKRRGRVLGMNPDEDGEQVVEAEVPMSEMQDFTTFLRQLTQGRGWFTFDFVRYETLPQMLEAKVIEQAKALGNFAEEEA